MTRVHTGPTERPSMPEAAPRRGVASRFWRGGTQTRVHHAARPKPNLLATLREWHKRLGLFAFFFMGWLGFSGFLINQSAG